MTENYHDISLPLAFYTSFSLSLILPSLSSSGLPPKTQGAGWIRVVGSESRWVGSGRCRWQPADYPDHPNDPNGPLRTQKPQRNPKRNVKDTLKKSVPTVPTIPNRFWGWSWDADRNLWMLSLDAALWRWLDSIVYTPECTPQTQWAYMASSRAKMKPALVAIIPFYSIGAALMHFPTYSETLAILHTIYTTRYFQQCHFGRNRRPRLVYHLSSCPVAKKA